SESIPYDPDLRLKDFIVQSLNDFIHHVEYYIIITIFIFILIDLFSQKANKLQLAIEKVESKKKELIIEIEFIINQLFLIDIPVLSGMVLIILFSTNCFSPLESRTEL
ncbi:MAG: hypothetical protein GY705_10435, partial [Bacteroidetes bacterium]|nr:hypothetical protein [Bacteroidota bacterium]